MKKSTLRRADLVFSLVLMALSVFCMIYCIKAFFNPFGRDFEKVSGDDIKNTIEQWYLSPSLVPFIFAAFLFICAVLLYQNARKDGAKFDFITKANLLSFVKNRELHVALIIIGILTVYIKGLIPFCRNHIDIFPRFQGFPFMIATWICLLVQMIIFSKKTPVKMLLAVIISAAAAAAITYGFGVLALIPLP